MYWKFFQTLLWFASKFICRKWRTSLQLNENITFECFVAAASSLLAKYLSYKSNEPSQCWYLLILFDKPRSSRSSLDASHRNTSEKTINFNPLALHLTFVWFLYARLVRIVINYLVQIHFDTLIVPSHDDNIII